MGTGTIIDIALWAASLFCGAVAVSGCAQMRRTRGGWREAPAWTAPLVFTAAAFALLTVAGVLGPLSGFLLTAAPLAVVTAKTARAWREIRKVKGAGVATRTVLGLLAARLRAALWNAREDVRDLTGPRRRAAGPAGEAAPVQAAPAPAPSRGGFVQGLVAAARDVPPLRDDGYLGDAPSPETVAGHGFGEGGAMVPPG